MKIVRRISSLVIPLASVAALVACSTTTAGPNAGAATAPDANAGATKPTIGQETMAIVGNKVQIVFPSGGASLTPDADKQLDLAARLFRDAHPVMMFTTGYTDRSGDEYANLLLSARRAEAVKRGLVARGIPADRLLIQALGESELANSSDPLSVENRRVVITWRLL